MAFSSVLQMYLGWANSVMCERGVLIEGLHELQDGVTFCHLIELLTGTDLRVVNQDDSDGEEQISLNTTVQLALDYLQGIGVHVKATAAGVVCGELKSILDMMWAIILHCTIHTPDRPVGQRTVRNGRKALLQWCREELDQNASFDINTTMVKSFSQNNLLSDLISIHCIFANDEADNDDELIENLTNAVLAAEDHLGISKTLLSPADVINGTSDEHALLIYIALLKRKVSVLMSRTSSLSSLSSNENAAFHIPMNCRHETPVLYALQIVDALQKAYSFRFIRNRNQRKGDLRNFLLSLKGFKLKPFQNGVSQARKTSVSSVAESSVSSQSIPVSMTSVPDSTKSIPDSNMSTRSIPVSSMSAQSAPDSSISTKSIPASSISIRSVVDSNMSAKSTSSSVSTKVATARSFASSGTSRKLTQSLESQASILPPSHQEDEPESGVDTSETQSVSYTINNWSNIASPSPPSSPVAKQSSSSHLNNRPQSPIWEKKSDASRQMPERSQESKIVYSHNKLPQERQSDLGQSSANYGNKNYGNKHCDNYHSDMYSQGNRNANKGQRSEDKQDGAGGDIHRERCQQGNRSMELPVYEMGAKPSATGDFLSKGEDELLSLLEAISLESSHLRQELSEAQQRESVLKNELDQSTSAAEEHVVSKLVQELEMLRAENQRLFRDSASARSNNAHDKKTTQKLQATINRLKNDVDQMNSENFRLNLRLKLHESHKIQTGRGGADGEEAERNHQALKDQEAAAEVYLMDQFLDLPSGSSSEELIQHLSSNQQLLGNFSEVNLQLAAKLSELNDELTKVKVGSRRLEQENQLLHMKAETCKLEADTTASRCHRLEDHLSLAQKKNTKLVQDLQGIVKETSPKGDTTRTFLRMRQLEEENALLKQRLELADEDRQLLKKELDQYKKNQSSIDAMFSSMSSRREPEERVDKQNIKREPEERVDKQTIKREPEERVDKQNIAMERVMQSVRGKDKRESGLTYGNIDQPPLNRNDDLDENKNLRLEQSGIKQERDVTTKENDNGFSQTKSTYRTMSQTRVRKASLGDLIVAKATDSPPMDNTEGGNDTGTENDTETETCTNQSDMSDIGDTPLFDIKNEHMDMITYSNRVQMSSKPSDTGDEVSDEKLTEDDMDSQTTDEYISLSHPRYKDETAHNSKHMGSKFNTFDFSLTNEKTKCDKTKSDLLHNDEKSSKYNRQSIDQNSMQIYEPKPYEERDNPRLARLQQLRSRLGIGKSGQNSTSLSPVTAKGNSNESAAGFEIKSRLGASGSRRRWNKFNSYKDDEDDLGSSYLDTSSKQTSALPSDVSETKVSKKESATTRSIAKPSHERNQDSHVGPQFGSVSLDEYVQSLKHRVQSLENENEEFDEYIKLPEQIDEPGKLVERSPKQGKIKTSPKQGKIKTSPKQSKSKQTDIATSSTKTPVDRSRQKPEILVSTERQQEQTAASLVPLPNRISGDGMSDGHGQLGEVTTDDDGVNQPPIQSNQIKSKPSKVKSPSNQTTGAKSTPSPARIAEPVEPQDEDMDSMVQSILSQSDRSVSSAGDTEKLHLSSSEDSKSYKHELLKAEEQEYANSIIEKYLEQVTVVPQGEV
ncbi:uncharacterized protein [Amphiura filiformis]|uniref:uncharacterized protein n=1 Tax=Amphiura filiformis TaxID=82378 RepID=UPI003B21693E